MDLPAAIPDIICKIVVIGDSNVGKTSLSRRFTENEFSTKFGETLGIDFTFKLIKVNNKLVKVQIWDTAGQEQYHCITSTYYRGAKAVIMAYDTTERKSFENITHWINTFEKFGDNEVERILIGNKKDLKKLRSVSKKEGEKLAKANNMMFSETSAKDNVNIEKIFMKLLEQVVTKYCEQTNVKDDSEKNKNETISLSRNSKQQKHKKKTCCSK